MSSAGVFTAAALGSATITATSTEDKKVSGSNTVTVAVSLALSATSATVPVDRSQLFTALVRGAANTAVTWRVNGVAGGDSEFGTITEQGVYTAPGTVPNPCAVNVTAASDADRSVSESATVTVVSDGPAYFQGYVFVSRDSTVCTYPGFQVPASAPCLSAQQSGTTAADLNVTVNGATSQVQYGGTSISVSASTTTATTDNRADAVG